MSGLQPDVSKSSVIKMVANLLLNIFLTILTFHLESQDIPHIWITDFWEGDFNSC